MNSKEYAKLYRERNKEKLAAQTKEWKKQNPLRIKQNSKLYYDQNRDAILEKSKQYREGLEVKERHRARNARLYKTNKDKILARMHERRRTHSEFINSIAISYGCRNPQCRWQGPFESWQLDFHHFDPSTKTKEVAKMVSLSYKNIVAEINKCIVLCRNCHADVHHGRTQITQDMLCEAKVPDAPRGHSRVRSL